MGAALADLHVDSQLTNVSVRYRNPNFIATQLFPIVPVTKESDKFVVYGRGNFRTPQTLRANKAEANQAEYEILGRPTFSCNEHALKDFVSDRDRAQADDPLSPEIDTTLELTDLLYLAHEVHLATKIGTAANYDTGHSTTLTGTDQWSDFANSDPIGDIRTAITQVLSVTGYLPNVFWMGWQVWDKLQDHPDILARTKSVGKDPTLERIAAIFQVEKVLVGAAIKNTAKVGVSDALGFVWGKDCGVAYVPSRPGIRVPGFGYTFQSRPFQVSKYAVPSRGKGTVAIEVSWIWDDQWVSIDNMTDADSIAGYVIKAAVA